MIRRFHEAPKAIFGRMQTLTDGDYCLAHLFDSDKIYRTQFIESRIHGREIILDNSVFELGVAFEPAEFAKIVRALQPTWYIVPDVLNSKEGTVESFHKFRNQYATLPGKRVGVVQGKSVTEIMDCYAQLEPHCDMIGISFDYSFYVQDDHAPTMESYMIGRQNLLKVMEADSRFNASKPHHLLGIALPQEVRGYRERHPWIYSIDTSNPVVHGLSAVQYLLEGLHDKLQQKLCDLVDVVPNGAQWWHILYNVEAFRRFCNE